MSEWQTQENTGVKLNLTTKTRPANVKLTTKVPASDLQFNPLEATEGFEITLTSTTLEQPYNFCFYENSKEIRWVGWGGGI